MKKTLLSILLAIPLLLKAEIGKDQYAQLSQGPTAVYGKGLELCQDRGFSHFLIKHISSTNQRGESLMFSGHTESEGGELIKETFELPTPSGKLHITYELLCFKEAPTDPLAVDVQGFFDFIALVSQKNQQLEQEKPTGESKVQELASMDEFKTLLKDNEGPVYLDCYSNNCPPCKILAPWYDQYSMDLAAKGSFYKINLENAPELAQEYEVQSLPTLLVFEQKKETDRKTGLPEILEYFESCKK